MHQAGKRERLYMCLVQQKTLQALQGSAIKKISNILQCTLPPRPICQTLRSPVGRLGAAVTEYKQHSLHLYNSIQAATICCFVNKWVRASFTLLPMVKSSSGTGLNSSVGLTAAAIAALAATPFSLQLSRLIVAAVLYAVTCVHFCSKNTFNILMVERP